MRPRVHFDGAPDRFAAMRKLFAPSSRLRVLHAAADRSRVSIRRPLRAVQAEADRIVARMRKPA